MGVEKLKEKGDEVGRETVFYGKAPEQFGDLWVPAQGSGWPLVVNIHGGFWKAEYDLNHANALCGALAARGIAVWNIEYRRVGQSGGDWTGTLEDARAAGALVPRLAARYPLNLDRVLLMGHSAGGQLALWLAAESALPCRGVVALAPVSDLRRAAAMRLSAGGDAVQRFLGGEPNEVSERYATASPYERLPIGVVQRVLHGSADQDVPLTLSERYVARAFALGEDATLTVLPGSGHMALIDPSSEAWPILWDSVTALL